LRLLFTQPFGILPRVINSAALAVSVLAGRSSCWLSNNGLGYSFTKETKAAKARPAETGPAETGAAKTGTIETRTAKTGTIETRTAKTGTTETKTTKPKTTEALKGA
jgi:hypothetical protein